MLPFPMIASGAVVGFLWLIYGLLIDNIFIKVLKPFKFNIYILFIFLLFQVQNIVGVFLCAIQLLLIFKYPKPENKKRN